ncbi:MAG: FAD-dependent oxidoreductase, partial [Candidatus Aminicenantes bacterium]|nr:FAD-dependent oxidoreductase [Candidatus Aminicenantes bacterium]
MSIKTVKTEILVIGAGAAGLTAGLYTARAGKRTLIIEGRSGASRLDIGYELENYPGFPSIDSRELRAKFLDHARRFGAEVIAGDVIAMSLDSDPKYVTTKDSFIEAKAVIIAMGKPFAKERLLPGEEAFIGLGVSYCATCDGPLYRGADVLAYGHSEEAVEDVLALAQTGCRVRWLPAAKQDKVPADLVERVTKAGVPVLWETKIKSLEGEGRLQKVVLEHGASALDTRPVLEGVAVAGLFIFREVPTGPLFSKAGLTLDHKGCIAVDRAQRTNL